MLQALRSSPGGLERLETPADGCWLHVVKPTEQDLEDVRGFGVPASLLDQVHDIDERPRVEVAGECVLVVLQYPAPTDRTDGPPWRTLPLNVLLTPRGVATVSLEAPPFLASMIESRDQPPDTARPVELVLQLCWHIADAYLAALRRINTRVEKLEDELRRTLRNEAVLGLLQQQKSLTYFATGLKSNDLMLERFESTTQAQLDAAGNELLAEVRIEMRQAIEMVEIAYSVLSDMMDAFASIVSNNLNSVMKVLTSVTILLAVPTLVASIYGMNVALPGEHSSGTFVGILIGCVVLCGALWLLFRRRNWL
ncbi:MAG TPA: magnesium transporter CorA family protein [Steroidobacteraceae bacterium]|jgi:magnesium transporter|nr:magnesium transporter CorA family protein [Steroidobacteraceae bacterium]